MGNSAKTSSGDGNIIFLNHSEIRDTLAGILEGLKFSPERAAQSAILFADATLDGVYSHGINRFSYYVRQLRDGYILPEAEPEVELSMPPFERWNGNLGPGNLNAVACMDRALELAGKHGMGMIAQRNTNHWMRGGAYGLQAARKDCIGICMTNTKPNMTPWGGRKPAIGNNPMIIAYPHEPYPVLLDMAMSQFSFGKLEILQAKGEKLPFHGGFNKEMELSKDPAEILETELSLPMGYWKGSALSIMIDLMVSVLGGGLNTTKLGELEDEHGVTQLFLAINLEKYTEKERRDATLRSILGSIADCPTTDEGKVHYPGEQTWQRRLENERHGIPVDRKTWEGIINMKH